MARKREHDEMADRKYLLKRGGVWYARFRLPERLGGGIFLRSLGTGDITTARRWRDLYVMPFLAAEDQYEATVALIDKAAQLGAAQDKRFKKLQLGRVSNGEAEFDALTLGALVERYLAHVRQGDLTPATIQAYTSHLGGFLRIVGENRTAESIQKADISAYRDRLLMLPVNWMRLKEPSPPGQARRTVSPAQVANALAYVKGLFEWAIDEEQIDLDANPVEGVKAPFAGGKKKRPFTKDEADAACNLSMPPSTRAFDKESWNSLPLIARYTGARLGEIAQLTGKDVVEVHGVTCLHIFEREAEGKTTKTHSERYVPVAMKIKRLVDKLRKKHGDGPLFPNCGTWIDSKFGVVKPAKFLGNAFQKAVKKIAPDLSFHSFRHFAITEMANQGVAEEVRMRIVGHKGRTVHAGYTQIDVQTMAGAVEKIY